MHAWKEVITPLLVNTAALEHVILCDADSRRTACFCSLQLQPHSDDGKKQNATRQKTVERDWQREIGLILPKKSETGETVTIFTGAKPAEGWHRSYLSFFQRYIVRDISLTWDISVARYFWACLLAHWNLIRHFEKHEAWRTVKRKIRAFWGTTRSPIFCGAVVYEQKFKSEYLERQIYERLLKSELSIVKFIENQSEHLLNWIACYFSYHTKRRRNVP